jgi:hypothetical protein
MPRMKITMPGTIASRPTLRASAKAAAPETYPFTLVEFGQFPGRKVRIDPVRL